MSNIDFTNTGYDYGIIPQMLLCGDFSFAEYFKDADCFGLLYHFFKSDQGESIPISLDFMFKNEQPAEKFMDILISWTEAADSDGNAVTIDFIEKNDVGYTVAISPEPNRFIERMVPKHLIGKICPNPILVVQFKEIDEVSASYLNFKANFCKAEKIKIGYVIATPHSTFNYSKKYFTKNEFKFYIENDIPNNGIAAMYKIVENKSVVYEQQLPDDAFFKPSMNDIITRRIDEIQTLLPITNHKLNNQWLRAIKNKLNKQFDSLTIDQAICNLIIIERIKQDSTFLIEVDDKTQLNFVIFNYLHSTYESFNSYYPPDNFFYEELIIKQIQNDKNELEKYLNQ